MEFSGHSVGSLVLGLLFSESASSPYVAGVVGAFLVVAILCLFTVAQVVTKLPLRTSVGVTILSAAVSSSVTFAVILMFGHVRPGNVCSP